MIHLGAVPKDSADTGRPLPALLPLLTRRWNGLHWRCWCLLCLGCSFPRGFPAKQTLQLADWFCASLQIKPEFCFQKMVLEFESQNIHLEVAAPHQTVTSSSASLQCSSALHLPERQTWGSPSSISLPLPHRLTGT